MIKRDLAFLAILVMVGSITQGCRTPPKLASELKLLVISDNVKPGKSMGPVNSSDCGYRYVSIGKYPSFRAALAKSGARYFKKVELKHVMNYSFYAEYECKSILAEGFK